MTHFEEAEVLDFGKVVYIQKNHSIPGLPDMNLLVLKKDGTYQAICIDIEIDATGSTLKEACSNLKTALVSYIRQMVNNYNGDAKAAMEDIVNVVFSEGKLKSLLFNRYLQSKHQYILNKIATENKAKSRKDVFFTACKKIFQLQPIQFNLTLAAGIA